jgi:DNA-directed RNA polymerase subunit RPC12/RpoP
MSIIIHKGDKFYCPSCGSLFVTALQDIDKSDRCRTKYFEFAEGQSGHPYENIKCKCGYRYTYPFII